MPRFANRDEEVELIIERYDRLQQSQYVQERLINYYGIPGIGKTRLLSEIRQRLSKRGNVPQAVLTFDDYEHSASSLHAKLHFLHDLFDSDVRSRLTPERISALEEQFAALETAQDDARVDALVQTFVEGLQELVQQQPMVLYLDACEHLRDSLFSWIERMVLLPLVQTERVLCVLASQIELRWRHYHVRRYVMSWNVQPLDEQATHIQIGEAEPIGADVHAITFGHPFASETLLSRLKEMDIEHPTQADVAKNRAALASYVVDALFDRLMADVSDEVRRVLDIVALFREFDVHVLRHILPRFLSQFAHRSQSSLHGSIRQLIETRLVHWNSEKRAYEIDMTIRHILAHSLLLNRPTYYRDIHAEAEAYYQNLLAQTRDVEPWGAYLAEYLFHLLQRMRNMETPPQADQVEEELRAALAAFDVRIEHFSLAGSWPTIQQRLEDDTELVQSLAASGVSLETLQHVLKNLGTQTQE
jgi:hypothetical protein